MRWFWEDRATSSERWAALRELVAAPSPPVEGLLDVVCGAGGEAAAWAALALLGLPESDALEDAAAVRGYEASLYTLEALVAAKVVAPMEVGWPEGVVAALARVWGGELSEGIDPAWVVAWSFGSWVRGRRLLEGEMQDLQVLLDRRLEEGLAGRLGVTIVPPPNPAPGHMFFGYVEVEAAAGSALLSRVGPFAMVRGGELEEALAEAGYMVLQGEVLERTVPGLSVCLIGPPRLHTLRELLFPVVAD